MKSNRQRKNVRQVKCLAKKDNGEKPILYFLIAFFALFLAFAKPALSHETMPVYTSSLNKIFYSSFPNLEQFVPSSAQIYPSNPATNVQDMEPALG